MSWKVSDGKYRVVVMNADGTPGVDTDGSFRIKMPNLPGIAGGMIGGGVLMLAIGAIVMFAVGRDPRHRTRRATVVPAPVAG